MSPRVEVIAYTKFIAPPSGSVPAPSQDQGTDAARLIEAAGRTCYDSYGRGRDSAAFHEHLCQVEHFSVIEHVSLSFFISGISRGCSHELVRHRVGIAISQRSTRYVDESESEWCWHPLLQRASWSASEAMGDIIGQARELYQRLVTEMEAVLVNAGELRAHARKQARGAARGVLGNALETSLVWTANLRALRHFIELRATDAADGEIRLLANRLYEAAHPYCPEWLAYKEVMATDGIGYCLTRKSP